jgi:hypothetical protein
VTEFKVGEWYDFKDHPKTGITIFYAHRDTDDPWDISLGFFDQEKKKFMIRAKYGGEYHVNDIDLKKFVWSPCIDPPVKDDWKVSIF